MDTETSVKTPLFIQHEGDFISPTRPLDISRTEDDRQFDDLEFQFENTTIQQKDADKEIKTGLPVSVSDSSFITAQSLAFREESDLSDMKHEIPISTWTYDDGNEDLTPVLNIEKAQVEELVTPKAEEYNTTYGTIRTDEIGINFSSSETQPERGLGIATKSNRINIAPAKNETEIQELPTKSSPVKAIRTSMLINGQLRNEDDKKFNEIITGVNQTDSHEPLTECQELTNSPKRSCTLKKSSELNLDDENYAYLFIIAVHPFNAKSLKNQEDISICLSFEKNDIAFVHTVDESGWGEVTLLKNARRGWVPFNYFSDTVKSSKVRKDCDDFEKIVESRIPLQKLLSASAKFLLHPHDTPLKGDTNMTFNIDYINEVRDGVKVILEMTECVSRSNKLVQKKPNIRKARKVLLANWYDLMIKADYYKHTTKQEHFDTLTKLLFGVLNQAFNFFSVWSKEKREFDEQINTNRQEALPIDDENNDNTTKDMPIADKREYLTAPPTAMNRLQEIYDILFCYVGLILGRLDMIEHNPSGCEVLETIVHQIIVLLRDLLYISKSCSAIIQEKFQYAYENTLHKNLDPLLSLVSELVSCVKILVTQTLQENLQIQTSKNLIKDEGYHYTDQGQRLTEIVANMTVLISNSINGCSSYLRLIGDIPLEADRQYLDLKRIKITPERFIQLCSLGITRALDKKIVNESLDNVALRKETTHKKLARFSSIRAGNDGELGFTYEGTQLLKGVMVDQKPFSRDSTFDPFTIDISNSSSLENEDDTINNRELIENEMVFSKEGVLVGASFRALIFKLTNELDKPDDYFIAAILLNFRSFGSEADLIDALIARFDYADKSSKYDCVEKNGSYSSRSSRLKNRRKLVCKTFQIWMESYWNYSSGRKFLPTLINFFNEGVASYLPIQSKSLLETAAKLSAFTTTSKRYNLGLETRDQLSPMTINRLKTGSIYSDISTTTLSSRLSIFSLDEKIIEEYELTKLPSQNTNSVSLPLPILNLGTSTLLSKHNVHDMEKLVYSYRSMLGSSVTGATSSNFPLKDDISRLITEWNELITSKIRAPKNIIHNDLNLADLNPLELAKQLTLIESQLFTSIKPSELLNENFLEKKRSLGRAPNVAAIVNFTNELCAYVLESLLFPKLSLKKRSNRLKSWLKIALSTTYFRNYNSLTSIMTALQNHAITRLYDVWNGLDDKEHDLYDYLSKIVHPNNNFKVYRKKIKKYIDENSFGELQSDKSPVPVVPFFNLFLQDLTFICEGNNTFRNPESFRPNKIVNVDKFLRITKTIDMVRYFQVNYDTYEEQDEKAHSFFNISAQLDVDTQHIKPIFLLQEFILCELWRVNSLYSEHKDRAYELSIQLIPRKQQN